jgi:hypothetical protein
MAASAGASRCAVPGYYAPALRLMGPGRMDEHNPQLALIFDAGKHSFRGEPLVHFYREEMGDMDWLRDYLMDDETAAMASDVADFSAMFHDDEAEENEVYNKSDLTTIESDSGWADV